MQISHSIHDYFSHAPTCFQTFSSDVSLSYFLKSSLQISRWSFMIEMAQILGSEFPFLFNTVAELELKYLYRYSLINILA